MFSELITYFKMNLEPLSENLKLLQNSDGSIEIDKIYEAEKILFDIKKPLYFLCDRTNSLGIYNAIIGDMEIWIKDGLNTPPYFNNVRESYKSIENSNVSFFWGPTIMANAGKKRGHYFEGFLIYREEPVECFSLYKKYPHPKNICQSCHLLAGTSGFETGNCLVFFPENIKATNKIEQQKYAVFFFNKFFHIYNRITIPTVISLIKSPVLKSAHLNSRQMYVARCIWGYLHDYFHHCGSKPFDENVYLKTRWAVGVLEEIKVDMQTLQTCLSDDIPYGQEVAELIIYERLFRYPQEPDFSRNFDSATGFFLLSWLEQKNAFKIHAENVEIDWNMLIKVIPELINIITNIENELKDETILEKATEVVFKYLQIPELNEDRFSPSQNINVKQLSQYFGQSKNEMNMLDHTAIECK